MSLGKDIIFDFEKSLSLQGDSGPYLQYTYARAGSILRKVQTECPDATPKVEGALLQEKETLELAKKLLWFKSKLSFAKWAMIAKAPIVVTV